MDSKTIVGHSEQNVKEVENKTAIKVITSEGIETITFGEIKSEAGLFAAYLRNNKGIEPKDKVGILSNPTIHYPSALLGILKSRAIPVPMDTELTYQENQTFVNEHELDVIVAPENQVDKTPDLPRIGLEKVGGPLPVRETQTERMNSEYYSRTELSDLGVLMPTSGTTGLPKLAELPHRNFDFVLERTIEKMKIGSSDVLSSIAPWHHIMGFTATLLLTLFRKCSLVYVYPNTELLKDLSKFLNRNDATIFLGVPKLYNKIYQRIEQKWTAQQLDKFKLGQRLLERQIKKKLGGKSLRFLASGGAALAPNVSEFFEEKNILCLEGYGLTETTALASFPAPSQNKPGYVGEPLPDTDIKIVKPDTLEEVEPGQPGEVIIAGDHLMNGYHNNPEKTKEVFVELNGKTYFRTGDQGVFSEDGYLKIKGRIKNTIVFSSGKNVNPEQVQAILEQSPKIEEALVKLGQKREVLKAFIYPNFKQLKQSGIIDSEKDQYTEREKNLILKEVWLGIETKNKELAPFKQIKSKRDVIIVEEPFPKTSTKKIKRHQVSVGEE